MTEFLAKSDLGRVFHSNARLVAATEVAFRRLKTGKAGLWPNVMIRRGKPIALIWGKRLWKARISLTNWKLDLC